MTFNFGVQLLIDLLSAGFVDRIGYRASMVMAHILSAFGLLLLTVLPEVLPSAFAGILAAVMVSAIGGGLLEVLVSPVVEACPSESKERAMNMLHSFYCWGHAGASEQAVSQWASAFAEKGLGISKTEGDLPVPLLSLVFCALCGLSVGMMWPGTFSKASAALPRGGMDVCTVGFRRGYWLFWWSCCGWNGIRHSGR